MNQTSKRVLALVAAVVVCVGVVGGILYIRIGGGEYGGQTPADEKQAGTFTFFDLGPDTKLSKTLRNHLEDLFGKGAVATHTTIDLTVPGIDIAGHFPDLQALNESLNYLPRQRVEHDTIQLIYRYAREQNIPFDRISLVFSGERQTPLFFSLYSRRDGADFIDSIEKKHGPPRTIGEENAASRALYWEKDNALLIISITRNRIGFNEYNFGIYYLDSLYALAETEKQAREAAQREKEKTGEMAF